MVCDDGLVEKLVPAEQFCSMLPLAALRVEGRDVTTGHHQTIDRQIKESKNREPKRDQIRQTGASNEENA